MAVTAFLNLALSVSDSNGAEVGPSPLRQGFTAQSTYATRDVKLLAGQDTLLSLPVEANLLVLYLGAATELTLKSDPADTGIPLCGTLPLGLPVVLPLTGTPVIYITNDAADEQHIRQWAL